MFVALPSPDRAPCLAFLSARRAVRPRAAGIAPAASAGCSQTALCTGNTNSHVTHTYTAVTDINFSLLIGF